MLGVQAEVTIELDRVPTPPPVADHPLGPSLAANQQVMEVLARDPGLASNALACLLAAKAPGTVRNYAATANRFKAFCDLSGLSYPDFSADAVLQYVLRMDRASAGFGTIAALKPALAYVEHSMGRETVFTPSLDLMLTGAKRRARAAAGPVKKAPPILPEELIAALSLAFPSGSRMGHSNAVFVRTAFRMLVVYHTLCRLDCFRHLKAFHFERVGTDILLTFPSAKNDQLHQGRDSCLVATDTEFCPVKICRIFFRRFGLSFGAAAADQSFVNFRLRRDRGLAVPIKHSCLSASQATADLRALLRAVGVDRPVTDKSIKMAGVTSAFAAGASTEDVMHIGRWRTPSIPLHYKLNSFAFKKAMASKIPSVGGD